jgi:cellulose synthase/poly-beta-1,6-N-acetylglucosamine synthase-like glycosyltransferase
VYTSYYSVLAPASNQLSEPTISVIIPVRNEAAKIEQCLKAVFSQSLKPYEVIVVDGHSTDGTVENIRKFPVKVFYESYYTRAGGCQVGIENAQGEYVAFTDADCIPDRDWLTNLAREFDDGIAGVGGRYEDIGQDLWTRSFNLTLRTFASGAKSRSNKKRFAGNLSVCGANGMCRREDILRAGGFNVNLSGAEDLELGHRLAKIGRLVYTPDAVVLHDHSRGFRDFAKQMYRYGGWRRESRLWDLQAVVPLVIPLVLLSLIVTPWVLLGILFLYLAVIIVMGVRFAIQEKNPKYLVSIPVAYIVEHSCYIVGFWKEVIKPRKKGVPWKK